MVHFYRLLCYFLYTWKILVQSLQFVILLLIHLINIGTFFTVYVISYTPQKYWFILYSEWSWVKKFSSLVAIQLLIHTLYNRYWYIVYSLFYHLSYTRKYRYSFTVWSITCYTPEKYWYVTSHKPKKYWNSIHIILLVVLHLNVGTYTWTCSWWYILKQL